METMCSILFVALGGALGSVARFLLSKAIQNSAHSAFPWGTFTVNIVGCLLIGMLYGLLSRHATTNKTLSLLLITGFCGGFTTFSTFSTESLSLIKSGEILLASVYIGGSIVLGLLTVGAGMYITNKL